jgi:hypothetical protein
LIEFSSCSFNSGTDFEKPYGEPAQLTAIKGARRATEKQLDDLIAEWDLKREPAGGLGPDGYRQPDLDVVLRECAFIRHCRDDAENLPYNEWRAMISNVVRCKDGETLVHDLSSPHPRYSVHKTDMQIRAALRFPKPVTCFYIQKEVNDRYCPECRHYLKITGSPAGCRYE